MPTDKYDPQIFDKYDPQIFDQYNLRALDRFSLAKSRPDSFRREMDGKQDKLSPQS